MRILDVHSHWGTQRGYVLRTAAALAQQSRTWRSEPKYVMFGADYPLFRYERLIDDWKGLGYDDDVLAHVFHRNAERVFGVPGA